MRWWIPLNLERIRESWSRTAADHFQLRQTIVRSLRTWVPLAGILLTGFGALAVAEFAHQLHVSATDLGFDPAMYALAAGPVLGVLAVLLAGYAGAAWLVHRLSGWLSKLRWWESLSVLALVGSAAVLLRWIAGAFVGSGVARVLVREMTLMAALGFGFGVLVSAGAAPRAISRTLQRFVAGGVLLVAVFTGGRLVGEGDELAFYAIGHASAADTEIPVSPLNFLFRPVRGVATFADGGESCVVRISERVYLATAVTINEVSVVIGDSVKFLATDCQP